MTGDLFEDTGARDGLTDRMHAVAATFQVTPPSAASVRHRAERRRTTRRAVGGGAAALVAAVLLLAPDRAVTTAPTPVPPATRASAPEETPPPVAAQVPTGWGPDVPHFAVGGQPMAGAEPWPGEATVRTMTEVSTGIVYTDPSTGQVMHRGWDDQVTLLGTTPWQHGVVDGEVLPPEKVGAIWGDYRELVGNPGHDLVAWVEGVDGARGDLVVVRPSTGEVLARTPVPGEPDREVLIASVDSEAVYFATPRGVVPSAFEIPGEDVWTWRWSTGEPPEDARDIADFIIDVSSGVWAVYGPRGVEFQDSDGRVLSTTGGDPGDRSYFGHTFSPDGRFWRGGSGTVTETATGQQKPGPSVDLRTAWSDGDELVSLDGNQLTVCTYPSGACSLPLDVRRRGQVDMPAF